MCSTLMRQRSRGRVWAAVLALAALTTSVEARSGRYLIVAAQDFGGSAPVAQLAAARTAQGLDVIVYTVPVGTAKETIRGIIQGWYDPAWRGYVLIVGDSDSSTAPSTATTIPHWEGGGWHTATTDLPYACMDGAADWYPEVSIGRFAVDTVAQLQAAVTKTLLVESGEFADPAYVQRAAMLATSDSISGAEPTHNWVIANYLTPAGFTSTKIYASQGGGTAQITAAVNAGALFTVYFGHSSFSSWWDPAFNTANVQALANAGLYGVVLAVSCGTAQFNWSYGETLGEFWIRESNKGAAAYIGTTDMIWTGPTEVWESVRRLEKYFFQSFFVDGEWEVGPAWQAALYRLLADPDYGPNHQHTRDYFEMFVLLGDPALRLPHFGLGSGDYDEDGDVDLGDLARLQACAGHAALGDCAAGNAAGGQVVDFADLQAFCSLLGGPG